LNSLPKWIESLGPSSPWVLLALFIAASALMIWRLEHMTESGVEGTVLGTLVMPYCSGLGNLIFVFVVVTSNVQGTEVMTNCLVNNVTNMTLLIGLPAIFWGISRTPKTTPKAKRKKKKNEEEHRLNRLAMLLTLTAVLFFTGAVWALARDGELNFTDGLVLVGLFLFWQCFHVFDVLKNNVRQNKSLNWMLAVDFALLLVGGYGVYVGVQGLVDWLSKIEVGFISAKNLGWLSGWLMVLPNALLALYYGWKRRPEVIYTSQVGDGHICIPLCVGLCALSKPIKNPPFFDSGILILVGAVALHFSTVLFFGQLPRFLGWLLAGVYGFFLYRGLLG
jgi:cation:H+ antiporter